MTKTEFIDAPPQPERLTEYDERHFITYIRILDANAEGADWREIAQILFGIDAAQEPERAKTVHDNHLARAKWMTESGYRHLLARGS
jgi:hypothetical protein